MIEIVRQYIAALTGSPDSTLDWRCIHDQRKDVPAHNFRGTFAEVGATLQQYNQSGYGIFANINALDGQGRELHNVAYIRAHVVDLDNPLTARASYERACTGNPPPTFAVQTSDGKFHIYWTVEPYTGNDFYSLQQRKLRQLYDGDKSVIDATRVLRVPGFYHLKGEPVMVTMWPISEQRTTADVINSALSGINIIDHFNSRYPLGEPTMSAPSFQWLRFALSLLDPNNLDRGEWVSFTAAIKQAAWLHADEPAIRAVWQEWCNLYTQNDEGENLKLWNSIRDTEVGWPSIERRTPVRGYMLFGHKDAPEPKQHALPPEVPQGPAAAQPVQQGYAEILDGVDCASWFKDCYWIGQHGKIFNRAGRMMDSSKFNGIYGGKHFIITSTGKTTDEAWKAALRSTVWNIPKLDHIRFLPERAPFEIIEDEMGRMGLNTYVPARIRAQEGDVTPWLVHVAKILPNPADQKLLFDYLAHCVKYPGFKIPWAPLIQSVEGVGKRAFFEVIQYALGSMYVYSPKAAELVASGSKFNAWMRNKLMIMVDEIKIDERRELVEILKPMITDSRIEIQGKGVDQDMEDNVANWLFFSNFKDAIPIKKSGRRYSIFFSTVQSLADIEAAGMNKEYFDYLWWWLRHGGGLQSVAYWLLNYPIEKGALPVRAPNTSSQAEALHISRSPMECVIVDCVADAVPGFRGGYVSTAAVLSRVKAAGIRTPSIRSIQTCLEEIGYTELGRATRSFAQEDVNNRTIIYGLLSNMPVDGYGFAQGYE